MRTVSVERGKKANKFGLTRASHLFVHWRASTVSQWRTVLGEWRRCVVVAAWLVITNSLRTTSFLQACQQSSLLQQMNEQQQRHGGNDVTAADARDVRTASTAQYFAQPNSTMNSKRSNYKKLIRRWGSEREHSLPRHRARTTKYNRLVHKFRHRSTRLCVGTHVYQIQWNNAI